MGLAASQARYLSLTARKSDLEYQAQTINSRRLQLSYQTAEAARAYSEGMNNKVIKKSYMATTDGTTTKNWENLNFSNLIENGTYSLIGAIGTSIVPAPYITYYTKSDGTRIEQSDYNKLDDEGKKEYNIHQEVNPNYTGTDIQTLLVSGNAQIVSKNFFDYLVKNGYTYEDGLKNYTEVLNKYTSETNSAPTVVDWRSDTTSSFKQTYYTEDDAQVQADYESATAELQAQDKQLECEEKNIETQHKAIETEVDAIKKVIEKNIEVSFKTFG